MGPNLEKIENKRPIERILEQRDIKLKYLTELYT